MERLDRRGGSNLLDVDLIAESGTNYIRYNSGLQICWGDGGYQSSDAWINVNFGKPFKDTNYIVALGVKRPNNDGWDSDMIGYDNLTTSGCRLYIWKQRTPTYIAIGKWK